MKKVKVMALCFAAAVSCLSLAACTAAKPGSDVTIQINSKKSLVHMGSVDSTALTEDGIKAAKLALDFLENRNAESARTAMKIYDGIIPKENYGGDYTAMQWLLTAALSSESERAAMMTDKTFESYYDFFAANDFDQLKEYLKRKYKLGNLQDKDPGDGIKRRAFLEDFILFNNPRREEWEKTSKMIEAIGLKPGTRVADIGSGPGYFTIKFARLVGEQGKVFAIDTVKEHLDYVSASAAKNGLKNIQPVQTSDHSIGMGEEKVDVAWMCSLYHIVYVTFNEKAKDEFVESIKKTLNPGGVLYVVDNGLVPDGVLPYHAPYIDKNLLIGQLEYYGFKYEKEYQFIPQRYILKFTKI